VLTLYYSDLYTGAIDDEARFPKSRYRKVRRRVADRLGGGVDIREAPRAEPGAMTAVHDAAFVRAFVEGTLDQDAVRAIGFRPWTGDFVDRALTIAGGSLAAFRDVFDGAAVAGNLAGGTHHAFADHGGGYCVFNDVALGAAASLEVGFNSVGIVDLDVHQGDGTAALMAGRDDVFTLSVHCAENYPFRKESSDLDIGVPEGAGDARYLSAVDEGLSAVEEWRPGLIIFQAGVDSLAEDELGRLEVSRGGLRRRNRRVFALAARLDVPVVVLMGGGYAEPIEASVSAHTDVFEAAAEFEEKRANEETLTEFENV
jgi:acetoin utilization deacetylase AcuC-like enzyme